jgi:hypothetical protein
MGFLVAAEAVHERHLQNTKELEHWPALTVNLCYTLELSLKSFITLHGADQRKLKNVGHNLIKCLAEAQSVGYTPTHPAISELIKILSPYHTSHSLRYLEGGAAELPEPRNMIAITREHVSGIHTQMWPRHPV